MKILVAGAAGFIGSHLVERLLNEGHTVVGVDNFVTGSDTNLEPLHDHGADTFRFLEHDITQPLELDEPFDVIFNLACPASPVDYQRIPLETLWVSAAGTKHLLDLAVKTNATFVHASTSEVYGDPLEHPQTESYWGNVNCLGPRSCYDEGKRFAESLIMNTGTKYDLPWKIVRIFNTYGPRMRHHDGRVIPNFITQALRNEPITIYGDGYQTRSFCYVDDMVDGLIKMMQKDNFHGPVNLGNPEEISIRRLAEEVIAVTQSQSKLTFKDLPEDDPKVRRPDISLATQMLEFSPQLSLNDGLEHTIDYFRSIDF
jgi:UDP-glucuronate decarboxylase